MVVYWNFVHIYSSLKCIVYSCFIRVSLQHILTVQGHHQLHMNYAKTISLDIIKNVFTRMLHPTELRVLQWQYVGFIIRNIQNIVI